MIDQIVAYVCLIWGLFVALVALTGFVQLYRHYSAPRRPSPLSTSPNAPPVTIIRPIKGLDPGLYDCLASTFQQNYPATKLIISLCLADRHDPALTVLEQLLSDFPEANARIYIEAEDPRLATHSPGPNPKIRTMSRAYREAAGNIVWIIDCNVWVGKGVCGRMVETLLGTPAAPPNKFVHQLPIVVDMEDLPVAPVPHGDADSAVVPLLSDPDIQIASQSTHSLTPRVLSSSYHGLWTTRGGRLEEAFMSSAHAKFYTAINTVLLAPCIVGKSNMFRRSHLDALTDGAGIDFFAHNICEDHLIGDLLWRRPVPASVAAAQADKRPWGNHALVWGDLAVQPMARMSVADYVARRVRWLRVRKYTVLLATVVEPGTECFVCSAYLAWAATSLPFFVAWIPRTWLAFVGIWLMATSIWAAADWVLFNVLQSFRAIDADSDTPAFARARGRRRKFPEWLLAWMGREALAWPVWAWAVLGGATVVWRGKGFWVGFDMRVHEVQGEEGSEGGKDRVD
ncbi:ceramide glucosyltransferase-like protein [Trichodelitschia bisporula]|uniref:Ceramide glucosyltransferase n=1 Tax=Trichodelitschia bisporula TaxID=703511 RepID=A0A6G1I4D9_9PEZI|nr:ceramide glucosyltransferase-like protein [Trichodelitschia bisporula]